MVRLNFDLRGYSFQTSLGVLRKSYTLASETMSTEVNRISSELTEYTQSGSIVGEWDEDGHLMWHRGQLLEMQLEEAEGGLLAFRKAIAIAIYHHWERAIQIYTASGKSTKFDDLKKRAEKKGVDIHCRLGAVRELANALKHNKGQSLRNSWPDLIGNRSSNCDPEDWYEAIVLQDRHIAEIFDVVAASGPQRHFPKRVS